MSNLCSCMAHGLGKHTCISGLHLTSHFPLSTRRSIRDNCTIATANMAARMRRLIPIAVIASLAYLTFAQEAVQEKPPVLNVGSLSTQEIEDELQVRIRHI